MNSSDESLIKSIVVLIDNCTKIQLQQSETIGKQTKIIIDLKQRLESLEKVVVELAAKHMNSQTIPYRKN